MSKHKKLLSLLLSAAMTASCLSGLSLSASAAQTDYVNVTFDESDYAEGKLISTASGREEPSQATVGNLTYESGPRKDGGDATTYIEIVKDSNNQYVKLFSGRFSSGGRNPRIKISGLPETAPNFYSISFKVLFSAANSLFTIRSNDGKTVYATVAAGAAGAEVNTWYNYTYSVINGSAYSILYSADNILLYNQSSAPAVMPSRIDGLEANENVFTALDDLRVYSDTNNTLGFLAPFLIYIIDSAENSIPGATVKIGNVSLTTDGNGEVGGYLPSGTYSVSANKIGYQPAEAVSFDTSDTELGIVLSAITDNAPASIVMSGGAARVYKPASGSVNVDAFSAAVYNSSELLLENAAVNWSIDGNPAGVSVENGVVTVTSDLAIADDNGVDLVVRATAAENAEVSATATVHVNNVARFSSFKISGNTNVKNGTAATYSATAPVDQYGNAYVFPEGETAVFSSNNDSFVMQENGAAMADFENASNPVQVTVTAKIGNITVNKTVNVHDYYMYEPGVGSNDHGFEVAKIGNETATVFTSAGNASLIFAEPLVFEANSIKEVSWQNTFIDQPVYTLDRYLSLRNGDKDAFTHLSYISDVVSYGDTKSGSTHNATDPIGKMSLTNGVWTTFTVLFKTDSAGKTTASITMTDDAGNILGSKEDIDVNEGVTQIDRIYFLQQSGADVRKLAFRNMVAKVSDKTGLEILGPASITKQYGKSVSSTYTYIDTAPIEGETIMWDLTAESGSTEGVTFDVADDNSFVITVSDQAVAGSVLNLLASSDSDDLKTAVMQITINDFASLKSFDIVGPVVATTNGSAKYSVANIIDEYDSKVTMTPSFEITNGAELAAISADGTLTAGSESGNITIAVTVGNPGKTMTKTIDVAIGSYYYSSSVTGDTMSFDVSTLIGAQSASAYKVSLLKNGSVSEEIVSTDNGTVTVNTAGASKVEVSPVFKLNLSTTPMDGYVKVDNIFGSTGVGWVGSVPSMSSSGAAMDNGVQIALADGFYDMSFKKGNGNRTDIMLNGHMLGNNVDQYGYGRAATGALYELKSVKVEGGFAKLYTSGYASGGNVITYVEVSKNADFAQRKTHIFIGGDSTVTSYFTINDTEDGKTQPWLASSSRQTGWSQVLGNYLTDDVVLVDLAEGGNYAESWIGSAFPGVEAQAQPGDYFFVQFGINDRNYGTKTVAGMRAALEEMVDRCVAKGIIPVLISPQNSVSLWGAGENPNGSGNAGFYDGVIESAVKKGALHIDLDSMTSELLGSWGKTYTNMNYHTYTTSSKPVGKDSLHLSFQGASICAALIAGSIYNQQQESIVDAQGNGFDGITVNTNYTYTFTDSTDAKVSVNALNIGKGQSLKASVSVTTLSSRDGINHYSVSADNATTENRTIRVIGACYDSNGALVEINYLKDFNLAPGDEQSYTYDISSTASNLPTKFFAWDVTTAQTPSVADTCHY